jgi:hypothetical protein
MKPTKGERLDIHLKRKINLEFRAARLKSEMVFFRIIIKNDNSLCDQKCFIGG